jgi:adenylate kinase
VGVKKADTPYQSIIFMGKTGCGKGTQAHRLAEELGFQVFSTGDRVRELAASETSLGHHIRDIHISGWVPEWLASYLFAHAVLDEHIDDGLVFESVARKPEEAKKLHEMHVMLNRPYIVLHLDTPDEVVLERMRGRGREGYDIEENMQKRMRAFYDETVHSIEFFREQGKVVDIDGAKSPDEVYQDVVKAISK